MPYINVKLAGNLNKEQKQEIAKEITDVMQRVANKPPSYTYIVFNEVASEDCRAYGRCRLWSRSRLRLLFVRTRR